jgi:hypothetical protein
MARKSKFIQIAPSSFIDRSGNLIECLYALDKGGIVWQYVNTLREKPGGWLKLHDKIK